MFFKEEKGFPPTTPPTRRPVRVFMILLSALAPALPAPAQDADLGRQRVELNFPDFTRSLPLDGLFRRSADGRRPLRFEIVRREDPAGLLSEAGISSSGTLELASRTHRSGTASITVRASFQRDFKVLANLATLNKPDTAALGMPPVQLITHHAYFTQNSYTGKYAFSSINENQLRHVMETMVNDEQPMVLDIENKEYFGNDARGRDNLARVLELVREFRPEARLLGYYSLLPDRAWWQPVNYRRAQDLGALGLNTWWNWHAAEFTQEYYDWQARNALYREASVTSFGGGGTVASKVSALYPSLYTFYRDSMGKHLQVTYDPAANRFSTPSCGFQNGNVIVFESSQGAALPSPLRRGQPFYVINSSSNNLSFQVAAQPDGSVPVQLAAGFTTPAYAARQNAGRTRCQDMDVVDWPYYAEENIAEARRFNLPVYAYISPIMKGMPVELGAYLEPEFFKLQLDTLRDLSDGVVIYDESLYLTSSVEATPYWPVLMQFLANLRPRTITFDLSSPGLSGKNLMDCSQEVTTAGCDLTGDGVFNYRDLKAFLENLELVQMPGDVDRDGAVTPTDLAVCRYQLGRDTSAANRACDFDRSGKVLADDLLELQRRLGYRLADVNHSGTVDSNDIITCFQNVSSSFVRVYEQCDLDGDKDVDEYDIGTVLAVSYRGCADAYEHCRPAGSGAGTFSQSGRKKGVKGKAAAKARAIKRLLRKIRRGAMR